MSRIVPQMLSAFIYLITAFPASAEPTRLGDLIIETPWARASIGMSRPAAAYITIRNEGKTTDILTGIETTVSAKSEVHKMEMKNGVASMGPAGPGRVDISVPIYSVGASGPEK